MLTKSRAETLKNCIKQGKLCVGTDFALAKLSDCRKATTAATAAEIASTALAKAKSKHIALATPLLRALEAVQQAGGK
jgi:hypothetical protein